MLIIEAEARVCERCYTGDLVPRVAMKGFYRKTKIQRIDSVCTHCNERVVGEWVYEEVETYLDKIEAGLDILRKEYYYKRVVEDVSSRVTDSLLSDDNENSPYLAQQYRYVCNVLDAIKSGAS